MGNTPTSFANKITNKITSGQNAFQTQGNKIMQAAEILRPHIAEWLKGCKSSDGLPIQPATVRAVALNAAQHLLKTHV